MCTLPFFRGIELNVHTSNCQKTVNEKTNSVFLINVHSELLRQFSHAPTFAMERKDLDGNAGAGNVVVCRRYCVDKGAQNFFKFRPLFFKQAFFCIEII